MKSIITIVLLTLGVLITVGIIGWFVPDVIVQGAFAVVVSVFLAVEIYKWILKKRKTD